jgi:hypothetical protein
MGLLCCAVTSESVGRYIRSQCSNSRHLNGCDEIYELNPVVSPSIRIELICNPAHTYMQYAAIRCFLVHTVVVVTTKRNAHRPGHSLQSHHYPYR